ncbi:MAG: hypothetical protein M0R32_11695 [Candidatus Cloacimonetes bacterium]|jgi:hypothetical protein|nr:hypothetical protein [Candidatus Cloacimonadota bacterium]
MKYLQFAVVFLAIALSGCKTSLTKGEVDTENQEGRIKVVSEQVYSDSLGTSYSVIVLFDSISGKSFISVRGGGISPID